MRGLSKGEREFKDVYITALKERTEDGCRHTLEAYRYESVSGAIKKYEDLILDHEGCKDKLLLVELQFITQNRYMTLKEKHLWES